MYDRNSQKDLGKKKKKTKMKKKKPKETKRKKVRKINKKGDFVRQGMNLHLRK